MSYPNLIFNKRLPRHEGNAANELVGSGKGALNATLSPLLLLLYDKGINKRDLSGEMETRAHLGAASGEGWRKGKVWVRVR